MSGVRLKTVRLDDRMAAYEAAEEAKRITSCRRVFRVVHKAGDREWEVTCYG